jgi:peptidyl-prolyl cis-trans isomerase SurA
MAKPGIKKANYDDAVLWAFTDSVLDQRPGGIGRSMSNASPLFTMGDTTINAASWIMYAQAFRYKADRSSLKSHQQLWDEFMKNTMYEYYRQHLEDYSDEFRMQMQEFRDGNLFFEIMQQEIWNKTQSDSTALLGIYEKNKAKYNWGPSAEAIIFFCSDAGTCKSLLEAVKKDPANWKKAAETYNEKVVADSGRYEWAQLPGLGKAAPVAGLITKETVNETDNTASFAYIIKSYKEPAPRTFNEARGLVMNDYQAWLEEQWLKDLKKKYPVKVDEKVFAKLK